MSLTIEIPDGASEVLRHAFGAGLNHAAVEAIAAEGYRSGKLSRYEVQRILGFESRWEAEEWMGARGLNSEYSVEDLEADRLALDATLSREKK